MYKLMITAIGVAAVALLALGCGSGEDEATAQVSEAQFMKQAKTICGKTQKELNAAFEKAKGGAELSKQSASLLKQEAEDLAAIEGEDGVEAKVEPLVDNISHVSVILTRDGAKGFSDPFVASYKAEAQSLGLEEC